MLKVIAATAAGAAVSGTGIESVIGSTSSPGGGTIMGRKPGTLTVSSPKIVAATAFTTYQTFPGADFEAGSSTNTWAVSGSTKSPTNGGFYFRRMQLPQKAVITEGTVWLVNPTTSINCYILSEDTLGGPFTFIGSGTAAPSASVQALTLSVTPTVVDNFGTWYDFDYEAGGANDTSIWGARIGWIKEPGLTLFPNPRRIIHGDATPFTSGVTYGPFDATLQNNGVTPTGIPAGATAAFCAVQSYTAGVLTMFPDLTTDPGIANYAASATGPLNLTYMMVPLSSAAKFKVHSYITGRCYVDAWGYVV